MDNKTLRIIFIICISVCLVSILAGTLVVVGNTKTDDIAAEPTQSYAALLFFTPVPLAALGFSIYVFVSSEKKRAAQLNNDVYEKAVQEKNEDNENPKRFKVSLMGLSNVVALTTLLIFIVFGSITFICAPDYSHDTAYIGTIGESLGIEFPETAVICTTVGRSNIYFEIVKQSGIRFTDKSQTDAFTSYVKGSDIWHDLNKALQADPKNVMLSFLKTEGEEYLYYCVYNKTKQAFDLFPDYKTEQNELIFVEYNTFNGNTWIYEIQSFVTFVEEEGESGGETSTLLYEVNF